MSVMKRVKFDTGDFLFLGDTMIRVDAIDSVCKADDESLEEGYKTRIVMRNSFKHLLKDDPETVSGMLVQALRTPALDGRSWAGGRGRR